MSSMGVSNVMGTTQSSLVNLLVSGGVSTSIASTLRTTPSAIESFINGRATDGIASALGTTVSSAQELRNSLGREGAVGVVIGLCVRR